jgi:hypothetical protein
VHENTISAGLKTARADAAPGLCWLPESLIEQPSLRAGTLVRASASTRTGTLDLEIRLYRARAGKPRGSETLWQAVRGSAPER